MMTQNKSYQGYSASPLELALSGPTSGNWVKVVQRIPMQGSAHGHANKSYKIEARHTALRN
jgi:multidrug resistance efflux pump